MVATIVHQLTRNLTPEEIKESGFGDYYIDHTLGVWPQAAGGIPQNACEFQVKADPITDIVEDMAAEQKARSTYDNILRVVKDPDVTCKRSCPLPAFRRSSPPDSGSSGFQKFLCLQSCY